MADGEIYVIENYQDFNVGLGMCQTEGIEAMEVAQEFFDVLAKGKPTPFIVYGNPAVKVFAQGKMEKGLKILNLDRDKYLELLAKKARIETAKKKAESDEITDLD